MNMPPINEQAHQEIERIFRLLLPQNGLTVREEQIALCHAMLDALLQNKITLCDAGVGIGKTYTYLTACVLLKKFHPADAQPVVVSTSSVKVWYGTTKDTGQTNRYCGTAPQPGGNPQALRFRKRMDGRRTEGHHSRKPVVSPI